MTFGHRNFRGRPNPYANIMAASLALSAVISVGWMAWKLWQHDF